MKTLTFADTLYPEKGNAHIAGPNGSSVWGTVMNEFRTDLPVAVPVYPEEEDHAVPVEDIATTTNTTTNSNSNSNSNSNNNNNSNTPPRPDAERPRGKGCFYLEGLLGLTLTLVAALATFTVELGAAIVFCVAAGFYYVVAVTETPEFIDAILMLVVHTLLVADAILLTSSILITEVVGWSASLVTSIFSPNCSQAGRAWHLYIRKVCHLYRWAFRGFHDNWKLKRTFPTVNENPSNGATNSHRPSSSSLSHAGRTDDRMAAAEETYMEVEIDVDQPYTANPATKLGNIMFRYPINEMRKYT